MEPLTLKQGQQLYDTKTGQALGLVQFDTKTGQRLATGATTQYNLPPATPPSNAGQVVQVNTPVLPQNSPVVNSPVDAFASSNGMKTQLDLLQQAEKERAAAAKAQADALAVEQKNAKKSILDIFNSTPSTSQTRNDAFSDIGVNPASYFADQRTKIAEIDTLNQEYGNIKSQMETEIANLAGQGTGIPMSVLNNQQAQIERNYAPKLNRISANVNSKAATLQALQGNFNEARNFVNQAVQDATADTKFKFDTISTFYDMNQDSISSLTSEYKDALNNSISIAEMTYKKDVEDRQFAGDGIMKYNSLGAGITINDTPAQVSQKIASVGGELGFYQQQQAIQQKYSASGDGGMVSTGVTSPEFTGIIDSVGNLAATAIKGRMARQSLSNALAGENYVDAYAQIGNAVEDSLTGEGKTKFQAARIDYNVMGGLREAVKDYAEAGGNTGLLRGNAEEITRKLGQVTDPKLTALAVQLQREFQSYRSNMTGAAFGKGESRDYESVNPSSTNKLDLNLAIIDGALNQLENRVVSTINTKVPGAQKIYSKVTSSIPPSSPGLESVGVSKQEEDIFNTVTQNSGGSGFWSDVWKGLGFK